MKEFKDMKQWALILGGSSGLGLATAKKLARHGLNICIVHRDARAQNEGIQKEFDVIKKEGVAFKVYNMDALKPEMRIKITDALKEEFGGHHKIKALVHSIAKGNLKPMVAADEAELQAEDFSLTLQAMAISLYDWTKAIYRADLFAQDARIISFSSEGNTKAWKHYAAISAAKVTLEAISRNIALEFAPYGIKANCIQAGVTDTHSLRMIPGSEQLMEHSIKRNPNKRLTLPEDVADAVYLLCKEEAKWITGTVIPVDGGEHLN